MDIEIKMKGIVTRIFFKKRNCLKLIVKIFPRA